MSAQHQDYELGSLDEAALERDEARARLEHHGDERRWMILGATGTVALCVASLGALLLGGGDQPHTLRAGIASAPRLTPPEPPTKVEAPAPRKLAQRPAAPRKRTAKKPPARPTPKPAKAQPRPSSGAKPFADLPKLQPEPAPPEPAPPSPV